MTMPTSISIGKCTLGFGFPTYLIAEIGSNHNQNLDLALEMIERSAQAGANAVKFQSIRYDKLYNPDKEPDEFRQWIAKIELDENWYFSLAQKAKDCEVDFISAPTYAEAIPLLEACDVPAYKLASPQVQANLPLVEKVAATGKPVLMSMGYCRYGEIENAIELVEKTGNNTIIPLHCVSRYPLNPAEANLRYLQTLSEMTGYCTGFSDHSSGSHLAVAAVALGASVIEKHVTTDRSLSGPDHHFAMLFSEFQQMVEQIRDIDVALGSGVRMKFLEEEQEYRTFVALKLFAAKSLSAGEPLSEQSLMLLRSNSPGLMESDLAMARRCVASRPIDAGELLSWDSLSYLGSEQ